MIMDKQAQKRKEERKAFDMAKQDILFLKDFELVTHDDKPDFVLKDKVGRKIGLEHFRADVYRVQDENSSHISGGHTVLDDSKDALFQKYNPIAVSDAWTDDILKQSTDDLFSGHMRKMLEMQSCYKYEAFLDNLHVGIHGRPPKVKGHVQKSKNYPDRESYDLMGFLIEVPVPSFHYHFETNGSQEVSKFYSWLCRLPLNLQGYEKIPKRFNEGYSYQKINGLPITSEIWTELNIFDDIDFIIIETHDSSYPEKHYGQYFTKDTPKPITYPAFSFGFTDITSTDVQVEHKDGKINVLFTSHTNRSKYDIAPTKTTLKAERRKQYRKSRKHFDEVTRKFRER